MIIVKQKKLVFLYMFTCSLNIHSLLCDNQPIISTFSHVVDKFLNNSIERKFIQDLITQTNQVLYFLQRRPLLNSNIRPEHYPEVSALLTRLKFARQMVLDLLPHNKDLQKAEKEDTLKLRTLTFEYFEALDKLSKTKNVER